MRVYYVRLTIMNFKLGEEAKKMIKLNKYTKSESGKNIKTLRIKCGCTTSESAMNYVLNKFVPIAEKNKIQFKVELFNSKGFNKKLGERLTKRNF